MSKVRERRTGFRQRAMDGGRVSAKRLLYERAGIERFECGGKTHD